MTTKNPNASLLELFDEAVKFDMDEAWRRCGYDSEKEPHIPYIVNGARGESLAREPIDAAVRLCIEAMEAIEAGDQSLGGKYGTAKDLRLIARNALTALRAALEKGTK